MQACTIGLPTVIRQFSIAASFVRANAEAVGPSRRRPIASRLRMDCGGRELIWPSNMAGAPDHLLKDLVKMNECNKRNLSGRARAGQAQMRSTKVRAGFSR